jgi:metal-dependent amidase/aminoacylase/carboxypeptidase family protein
MNAKALIPSKPIFANLNGLLPKLKNIYTDIHAHPELSMEETRTAGSQTLANFKVE